MYLRFVSYVNLSVPPEVKKLYMPPCKGKNTKQCKKCRKMLRFSKPPRKPCCANIERLYVAVICKTGILHRVTGQIYNGRFNDQRTVSLDTHVYLCLRKLWFSFQQTEETVKYTRYGAVHGITKSGYKILLFPKWGTFLKGSNLPFLRSIGIICLKISVFEEAHYWLHFSGKYPLSWSRLLSRSWLKSFM